MPHADPEAARAYQREYRRKQRRCPEVRKRENAYNRQYRAANWQKVREVNYAWRKANPDKWSACKRRHNQRNVRGSGKCPYAGVSLINTVLEVFYQTRDFLTELTGEEHHVDHIVPLSKGGQHVPWNVQVLTAQENLEKGHN